MRWPFSCAAMRSYTATVAVTRAMHALGVASAPSRRAHVKPSSLSSPRLPPLPEPLPLPLVVVVAWRLVTCASVSSLWAASGSSIHAPTSASWTETMMVGARLVAPIAHHTTHPRTPRQPQRRGGATHTTGDSLKDVGEGHCHVP